MKFPKLTRSVDRAMRATITVQFRLELQQLAQFFWDGSPASETCTDHKRPDVPASIIHKRVISSLMRRGEDFFVEDDLYWDNGGRQWALRQVSRVYRES